MTQRIIKFRAWDKERRIMVSKDNGIIILSTNGVSIDAEDYVVMQFTGLLDKNSKEIYEGDLIGYWHKAFWAVGWSDNKGKYMFQYPGSKDDILSSTGENLKGQDGFAVTKSVCAKKEIIGNIYENQLTK